ncbi:hypothetical protein [Nonomuraea sp. NPDC050691]|uniref:hypothetical protein n=1 Tax=Nonomuraea sp. NPDC050691 TaxID=3155661 RepID=UPI0033C3C448
MNATAGADELDRERADDDGSAGPYLGLAPYDMGIDLGDPNTSSVDYDTVESTTGFDLVIPVSLVLQP